MMSQPCAEQTNTKDVQVLAERLVEAATSLEGPGASDVRSGTSEIKMTTDANAELAGVLEEAALSTLDTLTQLEVRLGPATDSNLYTGFSQQVAGGGVFVSTHQYLGLMRQYGTRVAVTLRFPGGLKTRALGCVEFARDPKDVSAPISPGLGIKFLALTDDGHELVNQFAEHREPLFFTE